MGLHHVIIGGGPVATNAIETIRQVETDTSRITLVSDEPAHSRMALPYWLAGQIPRQQTMTADRATLERLAVDARIGRRAAAIDPARRTVTLDDGQQLDYDRLLIATGARPRRPKIAGVERPGVQPLWGLDDTQQLLSAAAAVEHPRVTMIGAGFVGLIMLGAMYRRGWQLTLVERETHILPRMLNAPAAAVAERWLTDRGVRIHCDTSVASIAEGSDAALRLSLGDGAPVDADCVILATGIRPNLELAQQAGIATDEGILVDARMQTSAEHVYAGGDVAQGPVLFRTERAIHAIHPTAVDHGRVAGANMAGKAVDYGGSLSMNVLDACGLQCASFGDWSNDDAEATTIERADGYLYRRLVWSEDRIRGAIFVGRANDVGMLTDVGMVKGLIQSGTRLGKWKAYLDQHPFDVRRAYVASGVAGQLAQTTLLGRPSVPRQVPGGGGEAPSGIDQAHRQFMQHRQP